MCGIAGIVNFKRKIDPNLINNILKDIYHRGPDHQNIYKNI